MDCEFAEFLGLNDYQDSSTESPTDQKEGSNLLNAQNINMELPPSWQYVTAWRMSMPVGQTYRRNHWTMLSIPGFIDGSSFVRQGNRKAGYAVTATDKVIKAQPLPVGTFAQKAEITALTRASNIWTDANYVFGVVHAHSTIWKEQGLLTQGKQIQHDINLPKSVTIIHCEGHQKGNTVQETGNKMVDQVAEQVLKEGFNSRW